MIKIIRNSSYLHLNQIGVSIKWHARMLKYFVNVTHQKAISLTTSLMMTSTSLTKLNIVCEERLYDRILLFSLITAATLCQV